ncbi:MAG: hypothetical protein MJY53_06340 [Bacteroidales bacterium]|nr:hypothetical protein [Bacteroidales bacterium]
MNDIIITVLEYLRVHHTRAFVKRMCIHNIQGNNLLGITRLLEVFGVKSRAVRLDDADDFKDLELPYLCSTNGGGFVLVTDSNDAGLTYTDGRKEKESDWDPFLKEVRMLAVMFSAKADAAEPDYKKHRWEEIYQNILWLIPAVWAIWMLAMQFAGISGPSSPEPPSPFKVLSLVLSAAGLLLCILLHRQWTGDGNAVEKVCSLFKTSSCSAAHDTFFFNRWFDLSEVGASYFLSILLIVLVTPRASWSAAWLILPALPASLWNLGYQFFKQKRWCPLCAGVQILFWITASAFLLCGAYSVTTFELCDIISAALLWGTLLVVILKAVTPAVRNRHKAESAQASLSAIKGKKEVENALLGEIDGGVRNITIAVSPTCPFCKTSLETIETILLPTGRFSLEKKYMAIHPGDKEKIEKLIGAEAAQENQKWCKEHDVAGTPAVFLNGRLLDGTYSIEDLLYI